MPNLTPNQEYALHIIDAHGTIYANDTHRIAYTTAVTLARHGLIDLHTTTTTYTTPEGEITAHREWTARAK